MAGEAGNGQGASRFSYKQMALYGVMLAVVSVMVVFAFGAFMAVSDMRHEADVSIAAALPRVEGRIDETFKLLETLAESETLYDPDVDVMEKVDFVDKVNEHFGSSCSAMWTPTSTCGTQRDLPAWPAARTCSACTPPASATSPTASWRAPTAPPSTTP